MKNESTDIELALQPVDAYESAGFEEQGAAGFSLLPAKSRPANDDELELSLVRVEHFSFS